MGMNPRLLRPLATGFNPRSIAGLNLWLDFSDTSPGNVTLDGSDKISNVTDKSGSGYNGEQTTSGNRPGISTLNGLQCADWGTSSNSFSLVYSHGSSSLNFQTGVMAAAWDAGGSTFPAFNSLISGPSANPLWFGTSGTGDLSATFMLWKLARINNSFQNMTGGTSLAAFPDITSTFVTEAAAASALSLDGWRLGMDRTFSGRGWLGRIGEVLLFNRQLSADESLRVRRYLATKWGAPAQT